MQHDDFITNCELKTSALLQDTGKKRPDKLPTPTKMSTASPLRSPLMKPVSPFERSGTKKKKLKRAPKTATALITRRPIEREFYKMRNASSTKQQNYMSNDKEAPPLKSSALRKMYRCDERTILDKQKKASRMQEKFEHLKKRHQDAGEEDSSSSYSSSDDEDNNASHVIHDLVERSVEDENRASLQRATQVAASSVYKLNVKQMWDELEHTEDGSGKDEVGKKKEGVTQAEKELARTIAEMSNEDYSNDLSLSTTGLSGRVIATYTSKIRPGRTPLGQSGIWRLSTPIPTDEMESKSELFHWPSPSEIKYPKHLDTSRASSYFYSKPIGRDGETCVTVLNSLAFKSPILAPFCYASSQGFVVPPFSQNECVSGTIPHIFFPGKSLMATKVDSGLDTLLRQPIIVVDPAASSKDHIRHGSKNSLDEFDENGFRRMTYADAIEYDDTISTRSFGISSAVPNDPIVSPPIIHTSNECCVEYLSRKRTTDDYHYIAENDGEGTHSEPYLFVSHMSAYHPRYVSKMSVSDQKKRLVAAKESESKKLNELSTALKLEGAEQLAKQRNADRVEQIKDSVKADVGKHVHPHVPTQAACVPFSLPSHALNLALDSQPKSDSNQSIGSAPRVLHNPIGKRSVEKGTNEPILKKLDENRKLSTSRATPTSYESEFATKTRSLFIQELTTERLKLSKSRGSQKKTEDSILSEIQHQHLDEILQVPVLSTSDAATGGIAEEEKQRRNDAMDPVTKAIMAVKNHNLSALEEVLDCEGDLDIETRDQHGNTLFILACQQGSKKLAKFLLRRGSNMNAQNHAGNTALHYLNEYNHANLADWLVRKGADDTLKNAEGLTAYEGVIFSL